MVNEAPGWVTEEISKILNQAIYGAQKSQEDDDA